MDETARFAPARRVRRRGARSLRARVAGRGLPQAGWNAGAHFALVESLADGTPRIDDHLNQSGDIAWIDGHFYAAKSPGLAVISLPLYLVLDGLDALPPKQEASPRASRARKLCPSAPSGGSTGWCSRRSSRCSCSSGGPSTISTASRSRRGAHAGPRHDALTVRRGVLLARALGGAGVRRVRVLLRERGRQSLWGLVAAGVLAGLAVFVELPLAVVASAWAPTRRSTRPARVGRPRYGRGLARGAVPLFAYNAWAFGSPFRNGYSNAVLELGETGHDVIGANDTGFFGLTYPRPDVLSTCWSPSAACSSSCPSRSPRRRTAPPGASSAPRGLPGGRRRRRSAALQRRVLPAVRRWLPRPAVPRPRPAVPRAATCGDSSALAARGARRRSRCRPSG